MKDERENLKVDEKVLAVLQRVKAEHHNMSYNWLLLHLITEHDYAEDLRSTLKSKGETEVEPIKMDYSRIGQLVRIPALEAEAEGMTQAEWEEKHGTKEAQAKILSALGLSSKVVIPYVPLRFGRGRPKGQKNVRPHKPYRKRLPLDGAK